LLIVLVCVSGVGTVAWLNLRQQTTTIRSGIFEQATRIGEVLARSTTPMLIREQVSSIRELAEEAQRSQGSAPVAPVVYVTVMDRNGRTLFDSHQSGKTPVLSPEVAKVLSDNALVSERLRLEVVPTVSGAPVLDVAVPCAVLGVDAVSRTYGVVRLGIGLKALESRWREALKASLVAGLLSIVLGLLVGFLATGSFLRFLRVMSRVVNRIAEGDLSPRIRETRRDELGELAGAIDRMAEDLQKRELLKRYISATAWDEIEERGVGDVAEEEVTLKEVTVLFLDIRNYTSFSEAYQSQEIVAMLNEVFSLLIEVVDDFGGVLDKFIGDALLVVFYPGAENDDAVRAVYAACRMQEELDNFNQKRRFYGRDAISIGVGINTGTVIAGSVGSAERKDHTVIGDPVNVAARLQERSKVGQHTKVILSETTYEQVSSLVEVEALEGDHLRGKQDAILAYEVVALNGLRAILDHLEAEDPEVRKEAFQALEATGGKQALPHLIRVLGSERKGAVLKAIPILARLGRESEQVRELLVELVSEDEDQKVLATAIRALGNLPGFGDHRKLETYLGHEDPRVRANTIEALDGLLSGDGLNVVAPLLHDPNQRVKANAAVMLWKNGRRAVVRVLVKLSQSEDARERASAVFALGELFASEAVSGVGGTSQEVLATVVEDLEQMRVMVEALEARLTDEDAVVLERSIQALGKARDTSTLLSVARLAESPRAGMETERIVSALARIGTPPRVARLLRQWRQLGRNSSSSSVT
jgi:class 3 adenylate cyclase